MAVEQSSTVYGFLHQSTTVSSSLGQISHLILKGGTERRQTAIAERQTGGEGSYTRYRRGQSTGQSGGGWTRSRRLEMTQFGSASVPLLQSGGNESAARPEDRDIEERKIGNISGKDSGQPLDNWNDYSIENVSGMK